MIKILLVYTGDGLNKNFINGFYSAGSASIQVVTSGREALEIAKTNKTDLLIAAEKLPDMSGLSLIEQLVTVNPFINSALVSALSDEDFHEKTEGLGILMPVPSDADEFFSVDLLNYFKKIVDTGSLSSKGQ